MVKLKISEFITIGLGWIFNFLSLLQIPYQLKIMKPLYDGHKYGKNNTFGYNSNPCFN